MMPRRLSCFLFAIALIGCACEPSAEIESAFPEALTAGDTLRAIDGEVVLLDSSFAIYGIRPLASPHRYQTAR